MRHLSNDELVALVEGSPEGLSHLESCTACRAEFAALRAVLDAVREDDVPEPSPLFWTHFSERVRQAVAAELRPAAAWRARIGLWRPVGALAAVALVLLAVWIGTERARPASSPASPSVVGAGAPDLAGRQAPRPAPGTDVLEANGSAVWEFDALAAADASWIAVADLAGELDLDSAGEAGLAIRPGSAERAAGQLSGAERSLLAGLLHEELSRSEL